VRMIECGFTGSGGQDYYTPDHYLTFDWIACG